MRDPEVLIFLKEQAKNASRSAFFLGTYRKFINTYQFPHEFVNSRRQTRSMEIALLLSHKKVQFRNFVTWNS
ncbi:hypothetical protein DP117_02890 [Brasilonema sp. UFV-L1]|nr:hypothetical protein [Brasilonema sp. UFV-L1]